MPLNIDPVPGEPIPSFSVKNILLDRPQLISNLATGSERQPDSFFDRLYITEPGCCKQQADRVLQLADIFLGRIVSLAPLRKAILNCKELFGFLDLPRALTHMLVEYQPID